MVAVAVLVPSLPCQRGMMSAGWLAAITACLNQACSALSSGRVPSTMARRVRVAVDDDLTVPEAIALGLRFHRSGLQSSLSGPAGLTRCEAAREWRGRGSSCRTCEIT